jgi:Spy/CpxP family protein refolding chaperone
MASLSKVKTQVWLLILVVFLLGGIAGASVDRLLLLKGQSNSPPGKGERGGRGRMIEQMQKDLNLTNEQTASVRAIFEDMRKEFSPRRFDECPGVKESREKSRARVRAILTPEQQKKYDEINAKRDAEMMKEPDVK